ncbi:hypothetical protein GGQ73_004430 [Rhizobium skierniewicense]|uniref:DUF2489 domain-containing protein n=1 Tax=Rhizobium skierniewicense TaxID=984260 RepID=A0A7W6CA25_9HYPH|nr:hypothetical protein [Rhizobium skierniewicense]MBB3948443.1 hypothetical protein [Rhizobium skierniewicense]
MITWWVVVFDFAKIVVQAGLALLVAWSAVKWALGRYKKEKHWEKKLAAYSDVLAATGTMNQIINEWIREEALDGSSATDDKGTRYRVLMRKLEETIPVAAFILPPEAAALLAKLQTDLHESSNIDRSWMSTLQQEWSILERTRTQLMKLGKADLGLK